jgi:hypothetical protein
MTDNKPHPGGPLLQGNAEMAHLQPVNETFSQKGEPLKSSYWVDGKLYCIVYQSGGTGRPHDPYYRKPRILGAVAGTDPVDGIDIPKGTKIRVHYHTHEGRRARFDFEV